MKKSPATLICTGCSLRSTVLLRSKHRKDAAIRVERLLVDELFGERGLERAPVVLGQQHVALVWVLVRRLAEIVAQMASVFADGRSECHAAQVAFSSSSAGSSTQRDDDILALRAQLEVA